MGSGEPTLSSSTVPPAPPLTLLSRAGVAAQGWLRGRRPSQVIFQLVWVGLGLVASWQAIAATLAGFHARIGAYDEGVLLTNANELLWGKLPYRDFYSNYPPGIFVLLAAAFKLCGPSVAVERVLGFVLHLAVALGAGRAAGRLVGERFSWMVAGLCLLWLFPVGVVAYAWLMALSLALLACELWARAQARGRPAGYFLAGAALGVLSWFRHDLFIYFTLALGATAALWVGNALRRRQRAPLNAVSWTLLGALALASVMWVPVFAWAGFERVVGDLYLDQVRHTMPARVLPFPALLRLGEVGWSPAPLPAFLRTQFAAAVVLTLAGPLLAVAAFFLPRRAGLTHRSHVIWLAALTLAVVPQMLGRTDVYHAVFTLTPALVASWLWIRGGAERRWRASVAWPSAVLGAALLYLPGQPWFADDEPAWENPAELARAARTPLNAGRAEALAFIRKYTRPGEPICVGLKDHRWTHSNDMDLYFLADRVGATRYMQFDPGLTNREEVQREMIGDLELHQPRVVILSTVRQRRNERNESQNAGSQLLDEYLNAHYVTKGRARQFILAVRKPASPDPAAPPSEQSGREPLTGAH
jgi:hypothetical protein